MGNLKFLRIESKRNVKLLVVDVHLNIGKTECWMVFTRIMKRTGVSCSSSSAVYSSAFASSLCSFWTSLVWYVLWPRPLTNFSFKVIKHPSRINVVVPIRLKFKLYVVLIEWGGRIKMLFVGHQAIVNYWDFPPYVCRNCLKLLVPKIIWHDQWEMFV